ncbi:MAG: sporulation protein Cse60 [Clostridium chrysemydis]|uniref:sporulation protein Cse60 n=1 Tax=Clostridium chrysemydis TaxID=2665504 RepID=UPI003F379E0F
MIQVKTFNDLQCDKEYNTVNEWLRKMESKIKDIKYSVAGLSADESAGWNTTYTSGVLIIYEII